MVMYFWERSASVWIALLYMVMGGLLLALHLYNNFIEIISDHSVHTNEHRLTRNRRDRKSVV